MMLVAEKAYAKLNLILDVAGKRPDGYHNLRTVFQSLTLHDTLVFSQRKDSRIVIAGNVPGLPTDSSNLVWRAAERLRHTYGTQQGVTVELVKNIPIAAGLGGGSSDAAAALRGLVRLWGLPSEPDVLLSLAAELGSDVPFCLAGGTSLGLGRGELLEELPPCPFYYVVLANPGFPVSTAQVFQCLQPKELAPHPDVAGLVRAIREGDRSGMEERLANVLERPTFRLFPAVEQLKIRMEAHGPSLMCGSGPTVFTLFSDADKANHLHADLLGQGIDAWRTETSVSHDAGGKQDA